MPAVACTVPGGINDVPSGWLVLPGDDGPHGQTTDK
jgi:hypothetical protein